MASNAPTAKCDKELKRADGGKDLFGLAHPRCANIINRSAWPARCTACHAIDSDSKARCERTIEGKKSIFCPRHAYMDGNGSPPPPAAASAASTTPPKAAGEAAAAADGTA